MKLQHDDIITDKVATYVGTLIRIDWGDNTGMVELDAKPGEDPVVVDCVFRYAGQHWIWNMEAYPDEDIASHSAFAFCVGDRVILLHKNKKPEQGQPGGKEYCAVAVLNPDDGSSIVKRKVWPLYRLGHKALALNFIYADLNKKGAGFPFITDDGTRTLVNQFSDWFGHPRAFGTPDGMGNHRVVVTKEEVVTQDGNTEPRWIPHAIHEFCEPDEDIPYVPDVMMQMEANYRGRVIGWSKNDELLIDNIPVARAGDQEYLDDKLAPSRIALTHTFLYPDEESGILTVIRLTTDCLASQRQLRQSSYILGRHPLLDNHLNRDGKAGLEPKYLFFVRIGRMDLNGLCIYDAILKPREELPIIPLEDDEENSWPFEPMGQFTEFDCTYYVYNERFPRVEVLKRGENTAILFTKHYIYNHIENEEYTCYNQKLTMTINVDDDGAINFEKTTGEQVALPVLDESKIESYVEHDEILYYQVGAELWASHEYISKDYARIKDEIIEECVRVNDSFMSFGLSGTHSYVANKDNLTSTYDTHMVKRYYHNGPSGIKFTIAEEEQKLSGTNVALPNFDIPPVLWYPENADNVRTTMSQIIFTHVDVKNGIYGFWKVTLLDDIRCRDLIDGNPIEKKQIKWEHYIKTETTQHLTQDFPVRFPDTSDGHYAARRALMELFCRPDTQFDDEQARSSGFKPIYHYSHNIWHLPVLKIDGVNVREIKRRDAEGLSPLNWQDHPDLPVISGGNFLTLYLGFKHRYLWPTALYYRYEHVLNEYIVWRHHQGDNLLYPFPADIEGVYAMSGNISFPYYESYCQSTDTSTWYNDCPGYVPQVAIEEQYLNPELGSFLYSPKSVEIQGVVLGYGEYCFRINGLSVSGNEYEYGVFSWPDGNLNCIALRQCTGRPDAIITLE